MYKTDNDIKILRKIKVIETIVQIQREQMELNIEYLSRLNKSLIFKEKQTTDNIKRTI
jgi:hypothetical protein